MIALAAAILAATHPESLRALYGAGLPDQADAALGPDAGDAGRNPEPIQFAVRGFDPDFGVFSEQVLCCAVSPDASSASPNSRRLGLVVEDSTAVMSRYGTSRLSELRREIACWVAVLAPGSTAQCRRLEALATASLLRNAQAQCAYRLPPLAVHAARPIVVVQLSVLQSFGRERFLRALWESQTGQTSFGAAGNASGLAGAPYEQGSLYDSLADRLREHFNRMGDGASVREGR